MGFDMRSADAMQIGKAGEYLVCADLILRGVVAFPSEQGLSYDVVADCNGKLIRLQVKTTRGARVVPQRENNTPACIFHVRRCGKGGRQSYCERDIDMFALVDLETRDIGYIFVSDASQTMILRSSKHRGSYFNEVMASRAALILEMRESGKSYEDISVSTGVAKATIARIITGKQLPRVEGAYLDELSWEDACAKIF